MDNERAVPATRDRCPVCGASLCVDHGPSQDDEYCPRGHYSYATTQGGTTVRVGDRTFAWSEEDGPREGQAGEILAASEELSRANPHAHSKPEE